jgi:ABC-type polysaccharide/polyol phosphate export permease
LLLSPIHVFFRDTAQVLGMLLMGWFYLTPIVYPLELVPPILQPWLEMNPLTALVGLYRSAFLGGSRVSIGDLGVLAGTALLLLCLGGWLFARLKTSLVDEL